MAVESLFATCGCVITGGNGSGDVTWARGTGYGVRGTGRRVGVCCGDRGGGGVSVALSVAKPAVERRGGLTLSFPSPPPFLFPFVHVP